MRILLSLLLISITVSCSSSRSKRSRPTELKSESNKKRKVLIEPMAFNILPLDSESFLVLEERTVKSIPKKLYVVSEESSGEAAFVNIENKHNEECPNTINKYWRYKNSFNGIPMERAKFVVQSDSLKFNSSKKMNFTKLQSEQPDCVIKVFENYKLVLCRWSADFYEGNENILSLSTFSRTNPSPKISFLGNIVIGDRKYNFLKSELNNVTDYHLISKEQEFIDIPKSVVPSCLVQESSVQESLEKNLIEQDLKIYQVDKAEGGSIYVESNGEEHPEKILVVYDDSSYIANFETTKDEKLEDEPQNSTERKLWLFELPDGVPQKGVLAMTPSSLKYFPFNRTKFTEEKISNELSEWIYKHSGEWTENPDKDWRNPENFCTNLVHGKVRELNCTFISGLFVNGKELVTSSKNQFGDSVVTLLGILQANSKEYYVVEYRAYNGIEYLVIPEDMKSIPVWRPSRPKTEE